MGDEGLQPPVIGAIFGIFGLICVGFCIFFCRNCKKVKIKRNNAAVYSAPGVRRIGMPRQAPTVSVVLEGPQMQLSGRSQAVNHSCKYANTTSLYGPPHLESNTKPACSDLPPTYDEAMKGTDIV